jgi:hypothetical protein
MKGIWAWYVARSLWLRIVLAVVAVFVVLGILGSLFGEDDVDQSAEVVEAPTASIADDQRTSPTPAVQAQAVASPSPSAQPTPTPEPTASPSPTPSLSPSPTPSPTPEEAIAQSIRDNRSFMSRASTDKMTVELTPVGLVTITIEPTLANETDALTVAGQTALVANRAIWTTYPDVQQIRVELLNEVTDANGAKSVVPVTFLQFNRATATPFQYDGLKQQATSDNKYMYCLADEYSIAPFIYAEVRDKGCLRGAASNQAPVPFPSAAPTPQPAPAATTAPTPTGAPRARPQGSDCPATHPIKGNDSSSGELIYHRPGQQAYDRTQPEECFATAAAAEAAGYRAAQR